MKKSQWQSLERYLELLRDEAFVLRNYIRNGGDGPQTVTASVASMIRLLTRIQEVLETSGVYDPLKCVAKTELPKSPELPHNSSL